MVFILFVVVILEEIPAALFHELFEILLEGCHDSAPVHIHGAFREDDVHFVQPVLQRLQIRSRNGPYSYNRLVVIPIDEAEVEVFQSELDPLEMRHFHLLQRKHEERRFRQIDQTVHCRLQEHIRPEGSPVEAQFPIRNVELQGPARDVFAELDEGLELLVQSAPLLALALLVFLFVQVVVGPPAHVEVLRLDACFRVELNVVGGLLPDEEGSVEMEVNQDDHFPVAGLEEGVLDVGEDDVDALAPMGGVAEPVLMRL